MNKRIIIAGGGTGGHFYPGFIIAKELIKENCQIVFAVKKNDISISILKENQIPYVEIDMVSLPRTLNPYKILVFLYKLLSSTIYSIKIINDFKPSIAIGTGSYVSFPVIFSAKLKKIKTIIHESNSVFGIGNYVSAFFSDKILLGLPIKDNPFKTKTILTGNPIRTDFFSPVDINKLREKLEIKEGILTMLVFGGSQGAKNINEAIYRLILDYITQKKTIQIIHITGKQNFEEIKNKYDQIDAKKLVKVLPYYNEMNELYALSDLVISRSGSGTISELISFKKPAILIPLKNSAKDHQNLNAQILLKHGCSIIIKDDENLYYNLKKIIHELINKNNLEAMKRAYDRIEVPEPKFALKNILKEINEMF